jgi:NTE family protein
VANSTQSLQIGIGQSSSLGSGINEWLLPRKRLKEIAQIFEISKEKIKKFKGDDWSLQDKCFKKVVRAYECDNWEKINASLELIVGIRNSRGRTIYDVLAEDEDAPPNFSKDFPENLVFQGGGPKGIAYIGVLEVLEARNILKHIKRVAGTSAGAITATLIALGCTSTEIKRLLTETPLNSFLDYLSCNGGLCKGEVFRGWMDQVIESKTGIKNCTFGELRQAIKTGKPFKHLHVVASKIGANKEIVHFSSDNKVWDNLIIADAVCASMSIPLLFQPHQLVFKTGEEYFRDETCSYVDGGVLANLSIEEFDKGRFITKPLSREAGNRHIDNKKTLAFSLYDPGELIPKKDTSVTSIGKTVVDSLSMRYHAESIIRRTKEFNKHRIVRISNVGVQTDDFSLSADKMRELINSGRASVTIFFREQEERLGRLQQLTHSKRINGPNTQTEAVFIIFKHKISDSNSLLGIEIYGKKVSFHTSIAQSLTLCLNKSEPDFSFDLLAKKDPRFDLFGYLRDGNLIQAEDIFKKNETFFHNCFLWDIFLELVIERNEKECIKFFQKKDFLLTAKM